MYGSLDGEMFKSVSGAPDVDPFRVYISAPSAPQSLRLLIDGGETSSVQGLTVVSEATDRCYDLNGRQVANPTSGIYIMGNQKVLVK